MDEDGEHLRDDVSEVIGAFDCIELDEVGNWCQGPVRLKVVNIKEVKDVRRLESLSVLSCYEIEAEKDDEGMTSVIEAVKDQAEKAYEIETTVMRCRRRIPDTVDATLVCRLGLPLGLLVYSHRVTLAARAGGGGLPLRSRHPAL